MGAKENSEGWFITLEGKILIPEKTVPDLVTLAHNITHLGKTSIQRLLQKYLVIPQLATLTQLANRLACTVSNITQDRDPSPAALPEEGVYPFQHLEMDFTKIQPSKTYWYLLVMIYTFTGWVDAYPIHTEEATELSRALAREIIPWFWVPSSIRPDNRPAFVNQVVKGISCAVRLTWDLHTWYHLQSSGQVERINTIIKIALAKQCQETGLPWPDVLLFTLFKIRCTPRK
jgi:hypothetical protein